MKPIETDTWFGNKKRPDWAGKVTIKFETIQHAHYGAIVRTTEVIGLVAPGATSGRGQAPEPLSPQRVSTAAAEPARYRYDETTGVNAYNTGSVDQEKGHVMALELGGPDIPANIVPQWAKWQGSGEWRRMEESILAEAEKGKPADPKAPGWRLMFHAVIRYPKGVDVRNAMLRRVCTPEGFTIKLTKIDKQSGQPLGGPYLCFDKDQHRNETDDMLAMRAFERLERDDMSYDDWSSPKDGGQGKKKRKGEFGDKGQSALYTPPPIKTTAAPVDFGAYMQQHGQKFSLDANGLIADESDDEDYVPDDEPKTKKPRS